MQKLIMGCFLCGAFWASGQSGPTLADVGYIGPLPIVAPGQVVQLQVTNMKTVLGASPIQAATTPLPLVIDGVSVTFNQSIRQSIMGTVVQLSFKAPLFSLKQRNLCTSDTAAADCLLTFITVQAPYELTVNSGGTNIQSQIVITESGIDSKAFDVTVLGDQLHVITGDDQQPQTGYPSIVTHADGSLVSSQSPAKAGEVVVVYAWGLDSRLAVTDGPPPVLKTGNVAPAPAALLQQIQIRFDFTANAAASGTFGGTSFATGYLTPGFVGLYQVNVQLPTTFPAVPSCDQVRSNLTINLSERYSFDGARICVQSAQ